MPRRYVPERGDIVWLHFDPQAGREQAGRRPAVVLSPEGCNQKTSLALFCPIADQRRRRPRLSARAFWADRHKGRMGEGTEASLKSLVG